MGQKKVCCTCRKTFSLYKNEAKEIKLVCPECVDITVIFNHKFRPPKQSEIKKWKVVDFLAKLGFVYQHIFTKDKENITIEVEYPIT